jgi:hypothetical protein
MLIGLLGGVRSMSLFGSQLTLAGRAELQNAGPDGAGLAGNARATPSLENILKLIPADIVALFIAGSGLSALQTTNLPANWPQIVFWVCMVICLLVRIVATRPETETGLSLKGVNWSLVVVTVVAFFVWAHAVSAVGPIISWLYGAIAGFFAMALGIIGPLFVRPE